MSPQTVRAAPDSSRLSPGPKSFWERIPVWLGLLLLAGSAGWTSFVLHREIERSVADELKLVLAAQIELAHALLGDSDAAAREHSDRGLSIGEQFAGVLSRLPVLSRIGRTGE